MAFKPKYVNNIVTPTGRVSFPHLEKPDSQGQYADDKYKATLLIPKSANLSGLKKAVLECARETWGANVDMKGILHPFRNGDKKAEKMPMYADTLFITCKSKNRPTIVDAGREGIEPGEVYGGCNARFVVTAMSYEQGGKPGVTLLLDVVQKTGDNDRFGGHADISVLDDGLLNDDDASNVVIDDSPGSDDMFDDAPVAAPAAGAGDDLDDLLG